MEERGVERAEAIGRHVKGLPIDDLSTRRTLLARASATAAALAVLPPVPLPQPSGGSLPEPDATLQAFADTMVPGRKAATTGLGGAIHPAAIAGVDGEPGAVEADALALYHHPNIGFDALEGPFLAELESRSAPRGGHFLDLPFAERSAVCIEGLAYDNPTRLLWEAAAAVPFTAFCAAALVPEQTADKAAGYRVMGLPGAAPRGYRSGYSYRRRLAKERTKTGSLP
jgi:hypothetical protein